MITREFYYRNYSAQLYPFLDIMLHSKNQVSLTEGLVDSGADFCCFSKQVAINLGIEVEKGEKLELKGVTENFYAYLHEIELQLFDRKIKCKVACSNNANFDTNVLGRLGFFEAHEITFKENEKKLEVKEV